MAIRVKLNDGRELLVEATVKEWDAAFRAASTRNAVLEIELPDGSINPIDPRSIESFQPDPDAFEAMERLGAAA